MNIYMLLKWAQDVYIPNTSKLDHNYIYSRFLFLSLSLSLWSLSSIFFYIPQDLLEVPPALEPSMVAIYVVYALKPRGEKPA